MRFHIISLKTAFYWLCLLFLAACEEPYNPEVIESSNKFLVVSGFINSNGPTTILLSRTQNLSESSAPQKETNATVTVEEENGEKFPLMEIAAGTYSSNALALNPAKKYRLFIKASGKEYASEYVTVQQTPAIDAVTWEAASDGLQIKVSTHDDRNSTRYYRWEYEESWEYLSFYHSVIEYVNGQIMDRTPDKMINLCYRFNNSTSIQIGNTLKLSQDVVSNFPLVKVPANSDKLDRKYSILVKQYAQTKESYEYWEALRKNTESLGSLFDPLPTQLTGNIRCLTSPEEPVIGYVSVSSVTEKRIFVTDTELPPSYRAPSPACSFDTVFLGEEAAYFGGGSNIPIDRIITNDRVLIGYGGASKPCVDCRTLGTTAKPAYWE
ncbi:DUF4249 domain-containing protein [Rufibacter hautae]|uniref:DUF4249 domain-containing protein n=1 Tax=Rufibacter hautae TaxID=2595005 RepID=A0A5B6TH41_9BACT|nr:DUF4249 domain-containing protein [Rufibacter hautae]KAA3438635.1 DUF4249 domain-containing protein [Rufibacter hautae]